MALESSPTRSQDTEAEYSARYASLQRRCRKERRTATPLTVAEWLLAAKPRWKNATWRKYKAAAIANWKSSVAARRPEAAECESAIALIAEVRQTGCAKASTATSATKSKRFTTKDQAAIFAALENSAARHAAALRDLLRASLAAGLRPIEWHKASLEPAEDGHVLKLVVQNGKHTNGRAHGQIRTLRWRKLGAEQIAAIEAFVGRANSFATRQEYLGYVACLCDLMHDVVREICPRRLRHVTIYSCRHEVAAMAKLVYAPEEVAALMGHAVDETASIHYGRAKKGGAQVARLWELLPEPDPEEVGRVRRKLEDGMQRLRTIAALRENARPGAAESVRGDVRSADREHLSGAGANGPGRRAWAFKELHLEDDAVAVENAGKEKGDEPAWDDFPVPAPSRTAADARKAQALESESLRRVADRRSAALLDALDQFLDQAKRGQRDPAQAHEDPLPGPTVRR